MRRCKKCNQAKQVEAFYAHPHCVGGRIHTCRECCAEYRRDFRAAHPDKEAERERRRLANPRRRAQQAAYLKASRRRCPEKNIAHYTVANHIKSGKLVRPSTCATCGRDCKPQAHHEDYSKPLVVIWLCFKCHREVAHGQKVFRDPDSHSLSVKQYPH